MIFENARVLHFKVLVESSVTGCAAEEDVDHKLNAMARKTTNRRFTAARAADLLLEL